MNKIKITNEIWRNINDDEQSNKPRSIMKKVISTYISYLNSDRRIEEAQWRVGNFTADVVKNCLVLLALFLSLLLPSYLLCPLSHYLRKGLHKSNDDP